MKTHSAVHSGIPHNVSDTSQEDAFIRRMREWFNELETCYRPEVRWWLAEGFHTDETLRKNVREIAQSGFGAAEFLAMPEPGVDSAVYGWGSREWASDTRLIIEEATRLGFGFSLTSGANWANANLPDTYVWKGKPFGPDSKAAAKELDVATILLHAGETYSGVLPLPAKGSPKDSDIHGTAAGYREQLFQAVIAARVLRPREGCGSSHGYAQGTGTGILDISSLTDLTGTVLQREDDPALNWTAPKNGEYALFVYWMHGTGQTASPSVHTNYTINYIDRYGVEAMMDYWEENILTEDLKEIIRKNGRGEIYMDSLELLTYGAGGIFWGYHIKEEFQGRKGYDITRYLPMLTTDSVRVTSGKAKQYDYVASDPAGNALAQKVRTDYYSVISVLYLENVLKPLQKWLHSLHMTLRAEPSYGMPYEISTPARYLDDVETESFAQAADVDLYRGMLGSANMYGRIFSSETGAVPGRNYYYNMDDWTQLCLLQFAGGVSRTVFHGYSAIEGSERDTYWPGHEGMYARFSERFNSRQPASVHYPGWTRMLARNQKVLRQGLPARDIAILRTDYSFINYGQPEGCNTFANNCFMHDMPYFWRDLTLQRAGYTYDYFSPLLLEDREHVSWTRDALQPDGPAYRAIIVYQESMELSSAKKLLCIAKGGLPILFVNHNTEVAAHDGTEIHHKKAASVCKYNKDSETELRAIVAEIKALPNTAEVENPAKTLSALQGLGVFPRVAFGGQNSKILTVSRRDTENMVFYTFVYSYRFELDKDAAPCSICLNIEGEGAPYCMDAWTGEVRRIGRYEIRDGRTRVPLTLQSGEAVIIALDLHSSGMPHAVSTTADDIVESKGILQAKAFASGKVETVLSNGESISSGVLVPNAIRLTKWNIVVEDWNEGEQVRITECKFGHRTTEVYYTTKKTKLVFENCGLAAWKDLPATKEQLATLAGEHPSMSHVSGIGTYTTDFDLPERWGEENGACLVMESAGGGSVEAWVNGKKTPGIDIRTLRVDITPLLRPGRNHLRIQVASTLTNRMLQRDYQSKKSRWTDSFPSVQDYGLMGDVSIVPYTTASLQTGHQNK